MVDALLPGLREMEPALKRQNKEAGKYSGDRAAEMVCNLLYFLTKVFLQSLLFLRKEIPSCHLLQLPALVQHKEVIE